MRQISREPLGLTLLTDHECRSTRPSRRPLAKILSLLHSVPGREGQAGTQENTYTSIAEDSVYQSLPPQPAAEPGAKTGYIVSDDTLAAF